MFSINNTAVAKILVNGVRTHFLPVNGVTVFDDEYETKWKVQYETVDHSLYSHEYYVYLSVDTATRRDSAFSKDVQVQIVLHYEDDSSTYTETLTLLTPISQRVIVDESPSEIPYIYQVDVYVNGILVHSGQPGQNNVYQGTVSFYVD